MKYFFLTAADDNQLPYITNLHDQMNVRHLTKSDAHKLERFVSLNVRPNKETVYSDVISNPLFMVSKGVAEVMSYYDDSVDYKIAALFDLENKVGTTYYIPIFDRIDCLTDGTEYNRDRSAVRHAVIDPKKTMGKAFFKLDGVKNTYVVARLDFAESLLRRKPLCVKLEEICLE